MSEWVSIDERLPEKMGNYRVYVQQSDYRPFQREAIYSSSHGGWITYEMGEPLKGVTHWMPLPEPPNTGPLQG